MRKYVHIGDRFGRLTVIEKGRSKPNRCYYVVQCDCGSPAKEVLGYVLTAGKTLSCGCLSKEHMRKVGRNNRKYANCLFCKSTILYNHGLCYKHYLAWHRGTLTDDQQKLADERIKNSFCLRQELKMGFE